MTEALELHDPCRRQRPSSCEDTHGSTKTASFNPLIKRHPKIQDVLTTMPVFDLQHSSFITM